MKKLIFINGTMGVGKSTVCGELSKVLDSSVFLDGDWCWKMNPHIVNEENKKMVMDNIAYLLNSYLKNQSFKYVIFCWVMHKEEIIEEILSTLSTHDFELHKFTLISPENLLVERLSNDINNGLRLEEIINKSRSRIRLYEVMNTIKIENKDLNTTVTTILEHINGSE